MIEATRENQTSSDSTHGRQLLATSRTCPQDDGRRTVREGLALFDRAVRIMTDGIRHQFPDATEEEVRRIRRERLALIRRLEEKH
jgi:hypothetical protein